MKAAVMLLIIFLGNIIYAEAQSVSNGTDSYLQQAILIASDKHSDDSKAAHEHGEDLYFKYRSVSDCQGNSDCISGWWKAHNEESKESKEPKPF
jgi:hypothetical protein